MLRAYHLDLRGATVCKIWRRLGLALSLDGVDMKHFNPCLKDSEKFAPPLPAQEVLHVLVQDTVHAAVALLGMSG